MSDEYLTQEIMLPEDWDEVVKQKASTASKKAWMPVLVCSLAIPLTGLPATEKELHLTQYRADDLVHRIEQSCLFTIRFPRFIIDRSAWLRGIFSASWS